MNKKLTTNMTEQAIREAVLSLTANLSMKERLDRFLAIFAKVTGNYACALLRYQEGVLVPVATRGLVPEVMGRQFPPDKHPRLAAILQSRTPVRFPVDDPRPDPYDALLLNDPGGRLPVHSCLGCSLYNENTLFGVLSADALEPGVFDGIDIDWEYPTLPGPGISHRPEDRGNFSLMLEDVRTKLDELGRAQRTLARFSPATALSTHSASEP